MLVCVDMAEGGTASGTVRRVDRVGGHAAARVERRDEVLPCQIGSDVRWVLQARVEGVQLGGGAGGGFQAEGDDLSSIVRGDEKGLAVRRGSYTCGGAARAQQCGIKCDWGSPAGVQQQAENCGRGSRGLRLLAALPARAKRGRAVPLLLSPAPWPGSGTVPWRSRAPVAESSEYHARMLSSRSVAYRNRPICWFPYLRRRV